MNPRNLKNDLRIPTTLTTNGRAIGTSIQGTSSGAILLQKTLSEQKRLNPSRTLGYHTQIQNHNTRSQDQRQSLQVIKPASAKVDLHKFQSKTKGFLKYTRDFAPQDGSGFVGFGNPPALVKDKLVRGAPQQLHGVPLSEKHAQVQIDVAKPRSRGTILNTLEGSTKAHPATTRRQKTGALLDLLNRRNEIAAPGKEPKEENLDDGDPLRSTRPPRSAPFRSAFSQANLNARSGWLRGPEGIAAADEEAVAIRDERRAVQERDPAENQARALVAYGGQDVVVVPSRESPLGGGLAIEGADDGHALTPMEPTRNDREKMRLAIPPGEERQDDAARVAQEIKELQKEVKYGGKKKKKTKARKNKSPAGGQAGDDERDEAAGTAFMTQVPRAGGEYVDSALRLDPQRKDAGKLSKSKSAIQQEKKVTRCLDYLGIKERYMLDHFEPDFQWALEQKAKERLAEQKAQADAYDEATCLFAPPQEEPQRHFYIDKYPTQQAAHDPGGRRMVPLSRSLAKVGSDGTLVKVEQTQYPAHPNERPRRLKVCRFDDRELQVMCAKAFKSEHDDWKLIQRVKDEKDLPYVESIEPARFQKSTHQGQLERAANATKYHRVHKKLMEALAEARRLKGLASEEDDVTDAKAFDPEAFIDDQFKGFSVNDLKDHQQTILNVFHHYMGLQGLEDQEAAQLDQGDAKEKLDEFKKLLPSFKERLAFVNSLKRRWREQNGYCSAFDRVRAEKLQKEKNELKRRVKQEKRRMRQQMARSGKLEGQEFVLHRRGYESDPAFGANAVHQIYPPGGDAAELLGAKEFIGHTEYRDTTRDQIDIPGGIMRDPLLSITSDGNMRSLSVSNARYGPQRVRNQDLDPGASSTPHRDGQEEPMSQKSLREWGSQVGPGASQGAKATANQKDMSAVYRHTKRDMESLEKYMSNIRVDSPGKEQVLVDAVVRRVAGGEGTAPTSPRLKEEHTLSRTSEQVVPVKRVPAQERTRSPNATNLSSFQLSPSAKQDLIGRQNEELHRKAKELEQALRSPSGDGQTAELDAGGRPHSHLDPAKEKIVVNLKQAESNGRNRRGVKSQRPGQRVAVATKPPKSQAELARKAVAQREIAPELEAKFSNPGVIFQPNNSMPQRAYLSAHVRRYKNIKSMVQLQLRGNRKSQSSLPGRGNKGDKSTSPHERNPGADRDVKLVHLAADGLAQLPNLDASDKKHSTQPMATSTPGLHHQTYLDNMNRTFQQYAQQVQQANEESAAEGQKQGRKQQARPTKPVLLLLGQPAGLSDPRTGHTPAATSTDPQKRKQDAQIPRSQHQGGQTQAPMVYKEQTDLLQDSQVSANKREVVKIKHQIDLTKKIHANHEASLPGFGGPYSPAKKMPIQIHRGGPARQVTTDVRQSQESHALQSAGDADRHGWIQASQHDPSVLLPESADRGLAGQEDITLEKYRSSDFRRKVHIGNSDNRDRDGTLPAALAVDPSRPLSSEDSRRSGARGDYHEMPKMLGVTTYGQPEAPPGASRAAGRGQATVQVPKVPGLTDGAAAGSLPAGSRAPQMAAQFQQPTAQQHLAMAGSPENRARHPAGRSPPPTGPSAPPTAEQPAYLNQSPDEESYVIALHPAAMRQRQMAPTASVHVNVPHQQFVEYQKSMTGFSPGKQHPSRQRMNQLMMQNSAHAQQAQETGDIAVTGQALKGVAMSPASIQQLIRARQVANQAVDAQQDGADGAPKQPLTTQVIRTRPGEPRGYLIAVNTDLLGRPSLEPPTAQHATDEAGSIKLGPTTQSSHQNLDRPAHLYDTRAPPTQPSAAGIKVMVRDEVDRISGSPASAAEAEQATVTMDAAMGDPPTTADRPVEEPEQFTEQRIEDRD